MDTKTARQLNQALAPLLSKSWHRATFVMDPDGSVVFHMGASDALRTETAAEGNGELDDEADDSLYLAGLEEGRLLGILFDDGVDIEVVREAASPLLIVVSGYLAAMHS